MEQPSCARALITGEVQGVGFRYFVTSHAEKFPITGYVRNLETGAVEIEVEGERDTIVDFLNEVRKGPRHARIAGFELEWKPFQKKYDRFFVKF